VSRVRSSWHCGDPNLLPWAPLAASTLLAASSAIASSRRLASHDDSAPACRRFSDSGHEQSATSEPAGLRARRISDHPAVSTFAPFDAARQSSERDVVTSSAADFTARRRRRYLIPVLTLGVAAAIFGWSRWTAPQRMEEIRLTVTTLLADAPTATASRPIDGTDPILVPLIRDALRAVREESDRTASAIGVDVRVGDLPDADGSASHHAIVAVGGRPRVTLRVRHAGTAGIRIVGVVTESSSREEPVP